jgi:hypothetical protein
MRGTRQQVALVHFLVILIQTSSQEQLHPTCFACGCSTCVVGHYEGRVPIPEGIRNQVGGFSEISCFQFSQAGLVGLIPPDICMLNRNREVQQACQCPPMPTTPSLPPNPSLSLTPSTLKVSTLPSEIALGGWPTIKPSSETSNGTPSRSTVPTNEPSQPAVKPTLMRPVSERPDEGISLTESAEPSTMSTAGIPSQRPHPQMPSCAPIGNSVKTQTLRPRKKMTLGKKFKQRSQSKSSKNINSLSSDHSDDKTERMSFKSGKGRMHNSRPNAKIKEPHQKKHHNGLDVRDKLVKLVKQHGLR